MNKSELIAAALNALLADQYDHGEWGKSEAVSNPTDQPRTREKSAAKPNLFTSSQAVYALIAAGRGSDAAITRFINWMKWLRRQDGFWVSASGRTGPTGSRTAEVINIRHTAKALDILLLRNDFAPTDAAIFHSILDARLPNGGFPQFSGEQAEIWSTAYIMNLLIRALASGNLERTRKSNFTADTWRAHLRTHLEQARSWICSCNSDGLWKVKDLEDSWATEAIMAEIGPDLALSRPDICQLVADKFLYLPGMRRRSVSLWGLLTTFSALRTSQQKDLVSAVSELVNSASRVKLDDDAMETACWLKLLLTAESPDLLGYYVHQSGGHESCLSDWSAWASEPYAIWSVQQAIDRTGKYEGTHSERPTSKADAWNVAQFVVEEFKRSVEQRRGWELLWETDGKPANEKSVQTLFWQVAKPLCSAKGFLAREPETGRGPVDFQFNNGISATVQIEFKLAASPKLLDGVGKQLIEYMNAEGMDSAIYVVAGFSKDEKEKYENLESAIEDLRIKHPTKFLWSIYIDATRKHGASKG